MHYSERKALFQDPPAKYRSLPFWSWNGKLEEQELYRQIDQLKEMGFGGFFIHSRVGLETEYLGEEWMDLCQKAAAYGKQVGLTAWLYDEDRWPSGSAGGTVTRKVENRARRLQLERYAPGQEAQIPWQEEPVFAAACRLEGADCFHPRPFAQGDVLAEGETAVVLSIRLSPCTDGYNGYTYLDTMNRAAVDDFMDSTYEAYQRKFGDTLPQLVAGIFTDEPHRGALFCDFSEGNAASVPYTEALFPEFEKRFGYDLKPRLLELFFRMEGAALSPVTRDFVELCQELFLENFCMPIYDWCQAHKLAFTGHYLHEDSLSAQTCMQGSLMRAYEFMHMPGMDLLTEHNGCYWVAKQLTSVGRQLGKTWMLTELYGCTGWQMKLEHYKNIGDWQAMLGVNMFCPHLSWYTMKGENKRDYPASILGQSTWYREWKALEDYFARLRVVQADGVPDCGLLVLSPIESIWARAYTGCFRWLDAADPAMQRIEETYRNVFHWLMNGGVDFDYGDEGILAAHAAVEDGKLWVGQAVYDRVLIAGADTLRSSTLTLLEQFAAAGGRVILAGPEPGYVDARPSDRPEQLPGARIPLEEAAVVAVCMGQDPVCSIWGTKSVYLQTRIREDSVFIGLLNRDRSQPAQGVTLTLRPGRLEQWDLRTGAITPVAALPCADGQQLQLDFAPGEEKVFLLFPGEAAGAEASAGEAAKTFTGEAPRHAAKGSADNAAKTSAGAAVPLQTDYAYRLTEENIAVLDAVTVYDAAGAAVVPRTEVLRADRALRQQLGLPLRGGEMVQPWFEQKYHPGEQNSRGIFTLEFLFDVETLPTGVSLILEDAQHVHSMTLNGNRIPMSPTGGWIDPAFTRFALPDAAFGPGENVLRLTYDYRKTNGLEAVYLLGNFGVSPSGDYKVSLGTLPARLQLGSITGQGLYFYSGKVDYLLDAPVNGGCRVTFDQPAAAAVRLLGETDVLLPFRPYTGRVQDLRGFQLVLTRRNTFGPLHEAQRIAGAYSPWNFITGDDNWTVEYGVLDYGLLENPTVVREA